MSELPPVVVLCGGQGTRIRSLLPPGCPKIMAPVCGVPFVDVLEDHLCKAGVDTVIYASGYGHYDLFWHLIDKNVKLTRYFSREMEPLGTMEAVRVAALKYYKILGEEFFVVNGDTICKLNFGAMLERHRTRRALMTVAVNFDFVNVGVYLFNTEAAKSILPKVDKPVNIEEFLITYQGWGLYCSDLPFFCDIGTPDGLAYLSTFNRNFQD